MMRIIALSVILEVAATAFLQSPYPPAGAAACSSCHGFTGLGDGVDVAGDMPVNRRAARPVWIETA